MGLNFLIEQSFWFRTILDLSLVFLILYWIFKVMRGTKGIYFINGIILLFLVFVASRYLQLALFSQLLNQLILMLMVAVPIIFQSELKRGLETLGRKNPIVKWFIKIPEITPESITIVTEAAGLLSQKRIGALIVFERGNPLTGVFQSGSYIDAVLSKIIIEQIFYPGSPLHDGAILIKDNRIQGAGCFLPLDNEISLPQELGSRHRAGLSLATQSDALVIIISEETGRISLAYHGRLESNFTQESLQSKLEELTYSSEKGTVTGSESVKSEVG